MNSAKQRSKSQSAVRSIHLLIVEDSEADCALLLEELRRHGFAPQSVRVDTASDMNEALLKRSWDLIVADYDLPGFSAPAALEVLQRSHLDIPLIVVSGSMGQETAASLMRAGAKDYVLKGRLNRLAPAVERELRETVRRRANRRVEQELIHSQQWLSAVIEASRDGIAVFESGILLSANPAFCSLHGYESAREVADRTVAEIMGAEAKDRLEMFEADWRRGRKRTALEEFRTKRKDGSQIEVEASVSMALIAGKTFMVAVTRDVGDRRRLEDQLRQSQKMEAIGKLAGGIAHDFNNVLTAITGYSQLALQKLEADNPTYLDLKEIKKAADKAAALTQQLLTFSRKRPVAPKVVSLNGIVSEMLKMLARLIGEHIELKTSLADALGQVIADPGQLQQIILNLAVNARDAMPEGGRLTIETANVEFNEEAPEFPWGPPPGQCVMLAVSDTGCGMDEETQSHIFEPFFTTKEPSKGTGLGLSTVYGIVEQNGGRIWVESEVNKGTAFKIYLPRVEASAVESQGSVTATTQPNASETILIVEDDEVVRGLMRRLLEREGYVVLEAAEGVKAMELCHSHSGQIHLLVTDVIMPGMNGWDLAQRVGELRPETRKLFLSGYTEESLAKKGLQDKGVHFIQKPFSPEFFAVKVREVLG